MTPRFDIIEEARKAPVRVPALVDAVCAASPGWMRGKVAMEVLRMIDDGALVVGDDCLVRLREQP